MTSTLRKLLAHPLTAGLDIDSPNTTNLRRQIIRDKVFLHRIYDEWYSSIARSLPAKPGGVLELGSGAGFLREYIPDLITSEIFSCDGIRAVIDGCDLPF